MTHWKKLTNPNFLGAYDFEPKEERTLQIESIKQELVPNSTGDKENCIVATLKGSKPIILNKTNCKTIAKIYGTNQIEDWAGKKITLFVASVRAFGETTDALRVKPTKPELPELYPTHEKWLGAIESLKSGKVTIEQIKKNYKLSKQHENELISASTAV